ncbi:MAG: hypothetical protein BWX68_02451 [Verrucomicrobia bacterium ADurb.Bin063]|nr:MAG: hypothetical protein BWX68_02451 [Verrucomicrobia bacterium ADurb.Bin063]
MGADVAERVALLDPFERAGRDPQRLLQVGRAIERRAEALLDFLANARVVGVVAFVHVHRDDAVFPPGQRDDLIRLGDVQAHGFFGDDMDPGLQGGEDDLRVQRVGCGHGHDIQAGKGAQDLAPRLGAGEGPGRVARPALEVSPGAPGGCFGARRHRGQLEPDRGQVPRPAVQSHPPELRAEPGALQIRVGPRMHVAAKHSGSNQRDLD